LLTCGILLLSIAIAMLVSPAAATAPVAGITSGRPKVSVAVLNCTYLKEVPSPEYAICTISVASIAADTTPGIAAADGKEFR
jgi:hypothetical protein